MHELCDNFSFFAFIYKFTVVCYSICRFPTYLFIVFLDPPSIFVPQLIWTSGSSRPEIFCSALKTYTQFTGKHMQQSFFNKVAGLRPATLLEKKLWHRCFPVKFAKFLRTIFLELLWWLLLLFGPPPPNSVYKFLRNNSLHRTF